MSMTGLFLATVLRALAQDPPPAPLSPAEALKSFRLQDGFRIELVAAEPDVMDPVAVAFDPDGRIYVAEMSDYPLGPASGRIRLLEDLDGDGRVDRSRIFASGIPYPTGVMPYRGGVLVTAAPDILFLKDEDGDGRAEFREAVFTGFKEGNQQHRVNGLLFAFDNHVHGTNGDSGGSVRRGSGPAVSISGRDFRFDLDLGGFEPRAGHGQFSNAFDDWGRRFINDNSNHLRHPVLPLKYLARNPHLAVSSVEEGISDHGGSSRIFPASRLQERLNDPFAANRFTSACAPTIFTSGAWGAEYAGNAFVCEPVHNLVHRDLILPKGASLLAKAAYADREFLASTDNWCRPVNLQVGPDGALYLVDMYRLVIEHPQWIPLEAQRRMDLRAGHDRGRIYRIVRDGSPPAPRPRLSSASAAELTAHLESGNAWWRLTSQRLLLERSAREAVPALKGLLRSPVPVARLHAAYLLHGWNELSEAERAGLLKDPHAALREHGLRLTEEAADPKAFKEAVLAAADDPDPRVRFQAALTMGGLRPDPRIVERLADVLRRDGSDPWVRLAVLSSLTDDAPALLKALAARGVTASGTGPLLWRQLADLVGASREPARVRAWIQVLVEDAEVPPAPWRPAALAALAPSLRRTSLSLESLLKEAGATATIDAWHRGFLRTVEDPAADAGSRAAAIELLSLLPSSGLAELFSARLHAKEPQEVQVAAVRALIRAGGEDRIASLLEGWAGYTTVVRREVLAGCFSKAALFPRVLDHLEKGMLRATELEPHHRDALLKHPSGEFQERARRALKPKGAEEIEAVVESVFAKMSMLKADLLAGEKVYLQNCATCHRLDGQGHAVGPSLSSVAGRDRKSLLTDILNPNAAVAPQFQVYVVRTPTAEGVSGIIASETAAGITLRRANGEETHVLRKDILEIKAWHASMMPEGLENNLSPQQLLDLIDFIRKGSR
jgi:putative membrane-bound dehydrogenase-like protein